MNESNLCSGLRVIEFSNSIGCAYAGWLLSRMGAEVARFVLPAEERAPATVDRRQSTFATLFAHLDSGKFSARLTPPADKALRELLIESDVLLLDEVSSFERAFGVKVEALRAELPQLVIGVAEVLPPTDGDRPAATGLDAQAVSGLLWAVGAPDREPLPLPPGVLEHQGGVNLAAAVLLAVLGRGRDGLGDRVDVSLGQVLSYYAYANAQGQLPWGLKWQRAGARAFASGGAYPYTLLPCKDGSVCLICRARDEWDRLVRAMGNPQWTQEPRYQDLRAMGTQYPQEVDELLGPWLAFRTRDELLAIGLEHSIPMAPVRTMAEVLNTPQFIARGALETLRLPEGEASVPSLPFHAADRESKADSRGARRRFTAQGAGEFSGWTSPRAPLPDGRKPTGTPGQPLAGLRILDLGWVWSAPLLTGILSEFGAEVVKVEHAGRLDNMRMRGRPIRPDGSRVEGPSIELSPSFHQVNHNKRGITLDLKKPEGLALLKRLAADSDLVIENMSPGAAVRAGFGYDALAELNPRLIMVSLSAAGQFGPGAGMRAYAPVMSSFTGLEGLIGYAGELPNGAMNVGLGDPNAAAHALVAIMGALNWRERNGRGCYVDLSQVESLLCCLAGPLIDASLGKPQPQPMGAAHPDMAPHGVYPAAGKDRWLTIAVADSSQWNSLCETMGDKGRGLDGRYPGVDARRRHRREVDSAIAAWTAGEDRDALCAKLRGVGVCATPVLDIAEVQRDPVFLWRDSRREVRHPVTGTESLVVAPWRFDRIRAEIASSSPLLGEHNVEVLCRLAGQTEESVKSLIAGGVVR